MTEVQQPPENAPDSSFVGKYNNDELQNSVAEMSSCYGEDLQADDSDSSDSSSSDDDRSNSTNAAASASNEIKEMARHETNAIRRWRLITLTVILLTGAAVATGSFLYLKNQESQDASNSYNLFTHSIRDASDLNFQQMSVVFHDMAETITAAATANQEGFPFVRVKLFEVPASQTRQLTGIEMFSWNPLVTALQRPAWKDFVNLHGDWYDESKAFMVNDDTNLLLQSSYAANATLRDYIWKNDGGPDGGAAVSVPADIPLLAPIWQMSPPPFSPTFLNYDMMQENYVATMLPVMQRTRDGLMSGFDPTLSRLAGIAVSQADHESFHQKFVDDINEGVTGYDHPHSVHVQPVFQELQNPGSALVGFLSCVVPWDRYLSSLLPETVEGITAVLRNSCGQAHTYILRGSRADYVGEGDHHDTAFDHTEVIVPLSKYRYNETQNVDGHCVYSFYLYSSVENESRSDTDLPYIFTVAVGVIFGAMALTFLVYDRFVRRRNNKVIDAATKSNEIINTLFPQQVRDRLFANKQGENNNGGVGGNSYLKNMMNSGDFARANNDDEVNDDIMYKTKPIADLFPETTILFGDIAGFTAWSSVREPSQVFILLETLYRAFDDIAKKRRVFKVETVGDCYVAVTGLPDPRKDHAVAMARFARDCLIKMRSLSKRLEVTLGPDTGDLAMRIGMHSGPVTAGVLRGERSRFQLFGDTMNTAARMESTGLRDKIQLSQETADLLIAAGKTNWLSQREDVVHAKGKGEMQTYWLEIATRQGSSVMDSSSQSGGSQVQEEDHDVTPTSRVFDSKTTRLIEWNVDVLLRLLKQIVARRKMCENVANSQRPDESFLMHQKKSGIMTMDEVAEIITLPEFRETEGDQGGDSIELPSMVVQQLHDYVCNIASIYRENPFHNFEHASHVTMSVVKLLSRIVAPHDVVLDEKNRAGKNIASTLHDHTYGITSDPLTQFSCVLSALIHDADHSGVPNATLVKEETEIAKQYQNKSVAEQNSVDLCWDLLMDSDYKELRQSIYSTDGELKRFRQLVVNSVMATDIVDKELKNLRNARWEKAFSEEEDLGNRDSVNRKATIVIEHLIQASDVAHTMQHWHVYRKWNERFFCECYQAYKDGRADTDPSVSWYKGEIGFFDFYIIPLAKKLKDCGVFGVSSDEYLNYAMKNRKEWEARGQEVVADMIEKVNASSNKE